MLKITKLTYLLLIAPQGVIPCLILKSAMTETDYAWWMLKIIIGSIYGVFFIASLILIKTKKDANRGNSILSY